jgi:carbamoyltransferase
MGQSLLLTLGHNSSAILLSDGHVLCGYEEERLSGIKSDSSFPELSINKMREEFEVSADVDIYISHWGIIPDEFLSKPNRWFNNYYILRHFPKSNVYAVGQNFTHHDAHAWSALAFAGDTVNPNSTAIIVADGFGSYGESISIYEVDSDNFDCNPRLISRAFGFSSSLGLFYQYSTSYLDLKENQDEYKLLGYEAHIGDIALTQSEIDLIKRQAYEDGKEQMNDILSFSIVPRFDPMCSLDALPAYKLHVYEQLKSVLKSLHVQPIEKDAAFGNVFRVRTIIAYYVQQRVESSMACIVGCLRNYNNLLLAGGVFMNVKLNNMISEMIPGKTTIMPLAGDQGAAIGIYQATMRDFVWPEHLAWGKRDLSKISEDVANGLIVFNEESHASEFVLSMLNKGAIVNLVRGSMEFGSRALCNTSSLMLPTRQNIENINTLNDRSTIMPCAPVMRRSKAEELFEHCDKINKSLEYMICTRYFKSDVHIEPLLGAAHIDPNTGAYTGRVQIVNEDDSFMVDLLNEVHGGVLVNTSFNYHGVPIVFDVDDILYTHEMQRSNLKDDIKIVTVVIKEGGL